MISGTYIGVVLAATSALSYASMNIVIKMFAPWVTGWQSGAGRFAFGLLALPILVPLFRSNIKMGDWAWLTTRSVCAVSAFVCGIFALLNAPISQVVVLFYINPVVAALIAPLIVGDRTRPREWPLILGAFAGVVLVLAPFSQAIELSIGHLFALASGTFVALTNIVTRRVIKSNTSWAIYFHVCCVGLIGCTLPMVGQGGPYTPITWQGWLGLALTGVTALSAQVTIAASLAHLKAHHTGVILSGEVIVVSLVGVLVLGEPVTWNLVAGGALILGCGLILNLSRGGDRKSSSLESETD